VYYQLLTPRGKKGKIPPNDQPIETVKPNWYRYLLNERDYR
jgi:hypothetical protein